MDHKQLLARRKDLKERQAAGQDVSAEMKDNERLIRESRKARNGGAPAPRPVQSQQPQRKTPPKRKTPPQVPQQQPEEPETPEGGKADTRAKAVIQAEKVHHDSMHSNGRAKFGTAYSLWTYKKYEIAVLEAKIAELQAREADLRMQARRDPAAAGVMV